MIVQWLETRNEVSLEICHWRQDNSRTDTSVSHLAACHTAPPSPLDSADIPGSHDLDNFARRTKQQVNQELIGDYGDLNFRNLQKKHIIYILLIYILISVDDG